MKTFDAVVVATGMTKTAVVEITRRTPHPLYRKLMKRTKRYKADTTEIAVEIGDSVKIQETRPLSKDKNFKVIHILSKKNQAGEVQTAKPKKVELVENKVKVSEEESTKPKVQKKPRKKKKDSK